MKTKNFKRKLIVACDVDDVLMPCISKAAVEVESRLGIHISYEECKEYNFTNFPQVIRDCFFDVMAEPEFYQDQMPYDGAVNFINALLDAGHEVVIASAVPPLMMGIRSEVMLHMFPRLNPHNIMLGARKDLLHVDFLIDDAMHNIEKSPAKYPVIMARPWNQHAKGYLRANSYEEILELVEKVAAAPSDSEKPSAAGHTGMVCVVGPAGAGKTFICDELVKNPLFKKARAVTTKEAAPNDPHKQDYIPVSDEQFEEYRENDMLLELTGDGYQYGILKSEVPSIWAEGKVAVKPVDMAGANACKAEYGDRCVTVYIRRNKEDIIQAILAKDIPNEEKAQRLMNLDQEFDNELLCDFTVSNNGSLEHAVRQIMRIVG